MFMIVNRHNEILARDGEFYPSEAMARLVTARLFATEAEADEYRKNLGDYTRALPVEASL